MKRGLAAVVGRALHTRCTAAATFLRLCLLFLVSCFEFCFVLFLVFVPFRLVWFRFVWCVCVGGLRLRYTPLPPLEELLTVVLVKKARLGYSAGPCGVSREEGNCFIFDTGDKAHPVVALLFLL